MNIRNYIIGSLFVILLPAQSGIAGNIIDTTDYPYWRELASSSSMFAAMKASAISTANNGRQTRDVMGGNSLAYILDPNNKAKYIANIKDKFETRINDMIIGTGAATSSVPSHELFYALLALDVIRYDLDPSVLSTYETIIESKIMKLVLDKWDPHGWAMRMLWYKYIGDEDNFQNAKLEFDIGLSEHYLPDGVSPAGSGYCIQRFNSIERAAKNTSLDIMEYMGYNEYYSNPGIIRLHEFMFGYATAPFGRSIFYGDTRQGQVSWTIERDVIVSPTIVKSARFSPEAHKYAMWVLREGAGISKGTLKGHLPNYIVMAGTAANNKPIEFNTDDAVMAPSRIFDNYAALISREESTDALYLSVQNLTGNTEYHTHYEVNALAMAGYGEILMRNPGYDGPNKDVTADGVTATFRFIHSNSESSNTLMIGGVKHSEQVGNGIIEGFVGQDIEYFRAANSISIDGNHFRDVMFVQPSNGVNGYYVVMDHVTTNNAGDNVNVVWHPNSATLQTIQDKTEYHSEIKKESGNDGPREFSSNEATLTTFLGTAPTSVEKKRTVNQASKFSYAADYLYANYNPVDRKADILTVLFPGDKSHEIGDMTRIVSGDYSGSEIIQGQILDVALTSGGRIIGQHGTEAFQGENVLYRKASGKLISYFVRGNSFDDGQRIRCGFKAEESVALYMNTSVDMGGMQGTIISNGSKITFYFPEISLLRLNGEAADIIASGPNWIQTEVPSGTCSVELVSP